MKNGDIESKGKGNFIKNMINRNPLWYLIIASIIGGGTGFGGGLVGGDKALETRIARLESEYIKVTELEKTVIELRVRFGYQEKALVEVKKSIEKLDDAIRENSK